MAVGTLLHEVLQHQEPGEINGAEGAGMVLRFDLSAEIALPTIREQFVRRVYLVGGREVELRGKVDGMTETTVEDHKTSTNPDLEYLIGTMQWRFYLDLTGRDRFRWNVFRLMEPTNKDPDVWRVVGLEVVEQWRYPSMGQALGQGRDDHLGGFLPGEGVEQAFEFALALGEGWDLGWDLTGHLWLLLVDGDRGVGPHNRLLEMRKGEGFLTRVRAGRLDQARQFLRVEAEGFVA
jgi:hypothetical protein